MTAVAEQLDVDNAADYARARGLVAPDEAVAVRALGGGVSSVVLRVDRERGEPFVLKQALARLRVAADWRADRARARTEHRCLAYLGEVLPPGSVPRVLMTDDERDAFAMTLAPPGGEPWKDALLRGEVRSETAARAGALLGRVHAAAAGDERVRAAFADRTTFEQLRVDPYLRTVAAARPELATAVLAELERMWATRRTLVLADYSPKNLIEYPDRVLALDVEVAHWGDPAFDVAFCLTHLVAKAVALPDCADALLGAAAALWDAYRDALGPSAEAWSLEPPTVALLGCLLAARVDGKSPLEYLDARGRERLRELSAQLLTAPPASVAAALASVA